MEHFKVHAILQCITWASMISGSSAVGAGFTSVTASAPVNPVEISGIFSLRCDVVKMKANQEMTIFRTVKGTTERLSVDDEVLDGAGDKIYLAVRQMTDGATVYLLSIMEVSREDEGVYMCKIFDMDTQQWVSQASLTLQIFYVPESEPTCAPVESYSVMEGSRININCSSESAFPVVSIHWGRTGNMPTPPSTERIHTNRVSSELTFIPTFKDHNVVFLCEISSPVFPDFMQTCHIGPFMILRNPNMVHETATQIPSSTETSHRIASDDNNAKHRPGIGGKRPGSDLSTECRSACSAYGYPILYWIIGTVVACILAIAFFIMGIVLVLKYRNLNVEPKPTYFFAQHPKEDIYTELECKRGDSTVYMSLGKTAAAPRKGQAIEAMAENDKQYSVKQTS